MNARRANRKNNQKRRAVVVVQVAVIMGVLIGAAAFSVDVGVMYNTRGDLQRAADAAALAAAEAMSNGDRNLDRVTRARNAAVKYVGLNHVMGESLLLTEGG